MKESKPGEMQILAIPREGEAGASSGGDLQRAWHQRGDLLCLEEQVRWRSARTYSEMALENPPIKDRAVAKIPTPLAKRQAVSVRSPSIAWRSSRHARRLACRRLCTALVSNDPGACNAEVTEAADAVVSEHGPGGFCKCDGRLRLDDRRWNCKRVQLVCRSLELNLPQRRKKRVPQREPVQHQAALFVNQSRVLDFRHNARYDGRRFRTLNVIDDASREALAIETCSSISAKRLIRLIAGLIEWCGRLTSRSARATGHR